MLALWTPVVTARTTVIRGEFLDNSIKWFYSVLIQLQYISFLATCFGFYKNHLQATVNYMEVHSVCTYIMESHSFYIKS